MEMICIDETDSMIKSRVCLMLLRLRLWKMAVKMYSNIYKYFVNAMKSAVSSIFHEHQFTEVSSRLIISNLVQSKKCDKI